MELDDLEHVEPSAWPVSTHANTDLVYKSIREKPQETHKGVTMFYCKRALKAVQWLERHTSFNKGMAVLPVLETRMP